MFNRHVTHLLTRYVNGTLRPSLKARVVNHVRVCDSCRAALARTERVYADVRYDIRQVSEPHQGQIAALWSGVWSEINAPRPRFTWSATLLPGVGMVLAAVLIVVVIVPLLIEGGLRVEAAPQQARPVSTSSPTPNLDETQEATGYHAEVPLPQATVAYVRDAGATPAPVPQLAVSPESAHSGARWQGVHDSR